MKFRKCPHGTPLARALRNDFLNKRKSFDKLLRTTERRYNRQKALEIEKINTSNPQDFWRQISNLGPKKQTTIPMKVYENYSTSGSDTTVDPHQVLDRWKLDFQGLYNIPEDASNIFDNTFYENVQNSLSDIKNKELHNLAADIEVYNQAMILKLGRP